MASGFVGELGAELLTTTINAAETRILRVSALNDTEGFYTLNIATSTAESCEALGDSPRNDTAETATTLWSEVTTQDCSETQDNQQISYSCPINSLNHAPEMLTYYRWEVPANSQSRLAVSSSSDSLAIEVLGPLTEEEVSVATVPLHRCHEGGLEVYDLAHVIMRPISFRYQTQQVKKPSTHSVERLLLRGAVKKTPLIARMQQTQMKTSGCKTSQVKNDSQATLIYLNPGLTSLTTNVCVNDIDWFSI